MDKNLPRHQKIKFRRDEIADLGNFPSACSVPPLGRAAVGRGFRLPGFRLLARLGVGLLAMGAVLAVAIYALGVSGIGTEKLRTQAEIAVEKLAGFDVGVSLGQVRITLDPSSFLALRVRDVVLKAADGTPMLSAGRVRFGVRLLPLLKGEVRLTSARISDARVTIGAMPSGAGDGWAISLRNADGLIDPDKFIAAVFGGVHKALDAVRLDSLREVELGNVEFDLPDGEPIKRLDVVNATVRQSGPGQMKLSSELSVDGRAVSLSAKAARGVPGGRIENLEADIDIAAGQASAADAGGARLGEATLHLSGAESDGESDSRLAASMSMKGSMLDLGRDGLLPTDIDLDAALVAGTNKIAINHLRMNVDRSVFDYEGSVGPKPSTGEAGEEPSYRYDLVSNHSTLAPSGSPEPALNFIARIAGVYQVRSHKLVAETIAIKSDRTGEAVGTASVHFVEGKAPGVSVAFNVHDMPVSHVKQLWPWFTAGNARLWVLENLFGGRVVDASLRYQVAPGRTGNGVPLSGDEVFGRFSIDGSRFDTAGRIPPVRDAQGVVEFYGNDVDISLSSGTVYMPSGRVVAASNGTLKIKQANRPPVIGLLDIDVAGEAPAIVELASYEPINAMRHIGLLPQDLSGTVTGNVKAEIPLQSNIETDTLDWLVSLDYKGLALAKPFEGQSVSAADGTITVDPQKAVISAHALLNGMPADVDLVEPLDAKGPPGSRKVVLTLDDKTREAFMPGLSTLLSGSMKIALERRSENSQHVTADLTNVRLNLPWAGWSKGPGIPAKVAFDMTDSGGTTNLSDFDLEGQTFAIDGSVSLSGGRLSSARFDRVRLNKGDDVSVSVRHAAKGYAVTVRGAALDARALIRQFTSDAQTVTKAAGTDAISVDADIKSLSGFHDEKLSGLKLTYSTTGARAGGLKVSAASLSGGVIDITNTISAGERKLGMKSSDAGAILRFLDVYQHVRGGGIELALAGEGDGPMRGTVTVRDFLVVGEPKLASIVSRPPAGDSRSLNQAVRGDIDTSRVQFERGFAQVDKGAGYLKLANGVLRGPLIGTTFQGTLYDQNDEMDVTGTFMPAYGLNRIFGEIPLVGALLGNGRDRGLIGVTYKLKGKADQPILYVNPLSVIAPGIFRSIFEYR